MADIINLRTLRKRLDRDKAREDAAASRARHGRSKGQVRREELEAGQRERTLDNAKKEED
jgi:hypothetical protein